MKRLRTEADVTQVHVSALVGVTRATVSQWESGVRHPSIKNLRKWCAALDVGVGEVLEGVEW